MIFASILVLGPDVYQLMKSIILSDYLCTFVPLPQRVTRKRLFPFVGAYVCQSYVSNPSCDTFIQNLPVQTSIHHSLSTPFESTHPRDTVAPFNTKLLPTSSPFLKICRHSNTNKEVGEDLQTCFPLDFPKLLSLLWILSFSTFTISTKAIVSRHSNQVGGHLQHCRTLPLPELLPPLHFGQGAPTIKRKLKFV